MKKLLHYLLSYTKEHISWASFAYISLCLTSIICYIYFSDFDQIYIKGNFGKPMRYVWVFVIEAVPFLLMAFSTYFFDRNVKWFFQKGFWLRFIFGFSLLAIDRSEISLLSLLDGLNQVDRFFMYKLLWRVKDFIYIVIPLACFYLFADRKNDLNWYGVVGKFDIKPYLFMLAFMFIVVGIGSFFSDLQAYYPKYGRTGGHAYAVAHGHSEWLTVFVYELFYGIDFFSVELFFRGFLVLAFTKYLGGHAVIAMVGAYVSLHSGKPVTEMISSAFGGYALGVIVYYTRSMWGGVMVHVGVAWMMEVFGYLQK